MLDADGSERAPTVGYIGQIARSAEQLGFAGALLPTSSWCEDGWVMAAALSQVTERFKFLVAYRPGLVSPLLAAQMAATLQRVSGGRLLLNVVTGGDDVEQARFGDRLSKPERYARAAEYLASAPRAVDRGAGRLLRRARRRPGSAADPRRRLAGGLPRRLLGRRARRRGPACRRLPDLGRATGRGRREARSCSGARRSGRPRAAFRHPPEHDLTRQRRAGVGACRPAARRPGSGDDRASAGDPAGVAV